MQQKSLTIPGSEAVQPYLKPFGMSVLVKTLFAPMERYRLIRQTQEILVLTQSERINSFVSYLRTIPRSQGIFSLWKSNTASIMLYFPQLASQLIFYENIKYGIGDSSSLLSSWISASLCSFTTLLLAYPFDTVRVRQASETGAQPQYNRFRKSFSLIKRKEGWRRGLYSGLSVAMLHSSLMAALTLGVNQLLEPIESINKHRLSLAYFSSFLILYPLDSIRHRQQVKSILFNQETLKQQGLMTKLKTHFASPISLYGGFSSHIVRCALMVALLEYA